MSKYIFIEGSYINSLKDGRRVIAELLREAGLNAFIVYGELEPAVEGLIENITEGRPLHTIPNLLMPEDYWEQVREVIQTDLSLIISQPYQYLEQLLAYPIHTYHVQTSRGCSVK